MGIEKTVNEDDDKVKFIEETVNEDDEDSDVNIYDYGIGEPILDVVKLDDVIESRNKIKAEKKTKINNRIIRKNEEQETTENPETTGEEPDLRWEEVVKGKNNIINRLKHQIQIRDKKIIRLRENLQNIVDDLNIEL